MSEENLIRPSQVTMAGWMVIVGSIVVVLTAFEQMGTFHTVEVREEVEKFLAGSPGKGLGLSVDSALTLMRVLSMVAAGCASAAAVLGWHVLRRHRPSRVALTAVAVPLFFSGIVAGGFFSSLVAASALMLWSRPARDWFDGVTRPKPVVTHPSGVPEPGTDVQGERSAPVAEPPPYAGFGAPVPPGVGLIDSLRARPDQVIWACGLTWVFSSITLLVLGFTTAGLLADGAALIDEARAQSPQFDTSGMSDRMLLLGLALFVAVLVVWALSAMVIAFFVWRGHEWARITMIISAGVTGGLAVVALIPSAGTALPLLIASGVVLRLLLTRQAAAWCRKPARGAPGPR